MDWIKKYKELKAIAKQIMVNGNLSDYIKTLNKIEEMELILIKIKDNK